MPHYKFDQIAFNITDKKMPEPGDEKMYIGLEHLDSGSLKITRWGSEVELTGQKLVMKKGDVLFGRRNTYLRRAAIAPHAGIFSAHGMIFRPKTQVIDPEYFPFFISSNYFMDAAIRISVGSLSPTVNWKTLKELEFDLPSLEEQRKNAALLKSINETKEAYQELLIQTDNLVKSQFIEMFGDIENNAKGYPVKCISDFADLFAGATPSTKVSAYWENGTIPWMSSGEVHMGKVTSTEKKISQLGYDKCSTKMVPIHSVVIALAGQGKTRGTVAITEIDLCTNQSLCAMVTDGTVLSDYLYHNLRNRYDEIRNMCAIADGRGGLNLKIVGSIKVIVPSIDEQKAFVAFANQSDKSKFELKEAIKSCDALMKAILFTNLEEKEG